MDLLHHPMRKLLHYLLRHLLTMPGSRPPVVPGQTALLPWSGS
ncbi:hypothetical protein [Streptomyces sp. NPDC001269]